MPFSALPPRSKRSPLLRRAPRLARLRHRLPTQNNPKISRSNRIVRPLGGIAILLLAGLLVRGWTTWRFNAANQIERAARAQFIPQLERQLGQKIEVGKFSTDWLGRIQIQDIVVGRNTKLPTGALLQAKSVTLTLDLVGLALGRTKFPGAITAVDLNSPTVYIKRDARGKINLTSLLSSSSGGNGTRWTGRVGFQNARVFYTDDLISNLHKQKLQVDARGANGQVLVSSPAPKSSAIEFEVRPTQTFLGSQNLGSFPLQGRVVSADKTPARGWLETQTPTLPVKLAAQWIRLPVALEGGTVGGRLQLAFANNEFAPRGGLTVREGAFRLIRTGAPSVSVRALNGPLSFAGTAVESAGLSAQIAGTTWTAKGRAAIGKGDPIFDGDIATRGLALANVRSLLGPGVLPPQLSAANLDLNAHASGTLQTLRGDGTLTAHTVAWIDANGRRATFPIIRATGVLARNGKAPLQVAARFQSQGGEAQTPLARLRSITVKAPNWSGSVRGGGNAWDVDARGDNVVISSPVLGQSGVATIRLVASSPDISRANWRGALQLNRASTSGVRLAALFPRASLLQRSGTLSGLLNFEGSPRQLAAARAAGTLSLSEAAISPEAIPVSARAQISRVLGSSFDIRAWLAARDLRADVSLVGGQLQVQNARAQTAVGSASGSFSTSVRNFAPRFAFSSPQLDLPTTLLFDAARAQGVQLDGNWSARGSIAGEGNTQGVAVRGVMSMSAPRFLARSQNGTGRLEGAGANVRVTANLGAGTARWRAILNCDSLLANSGKLGTTGLVIPTDLNGGHLVGAQVVASSLPFSSATGINTAWTTTLRADRVALPLRTLPGRPVITFRTINAVVNPLSKGITVPRFSALWGGTGHIDGTLSLGGAGGGISGEILAREVEAQALQTLLAQTSRRGARLDGRLNFKAVLRPNVVPQIDAQMAKGMLTLPANGRTISLPIRALGVRTQVGKTSVQFQNARALVGEAPIEADGRVLLSTGRIETDVQLSNLSLAPFISELTGSSAQQVAGLVSGKASLSFDTRTSQISVDALAHLDGGAFRGVELDQTDARVNAKWNLSRATGSLSVRDWRGELEGAPFSGEVALDDEANTWNVQLAAQKIELQDVARLKARLQNAGATAGSLVQLAPPVAGTANVVLDLKGALRDERNRFVFRPQSGLARLSVPDLEWRARSLGTLTGTFNVADGRVTFEPLQLAPPDTANAPTISLVGSVPLDAKSGPLDARLSVGEAPLDFFLQTLEDSEDVLGASSSSSPFLQSVVNYASNLPRGLQGRIALEAQFGGTFRDPIFKVSRLSLRNGRAPLPLGGLSLPATLDAGFTFAKGEVTFDQADFRLAKAERNAQGEPIAQPVAGAAPPDPSVEEEDTVLQVQSGSKLSIEGQSDLVADVYNANLSQLAPWVPALRGKDGQPLLIGQLESFSLRVQGPVRDPIVTGSVEAQNIAFRGYSLERLRVARFDIGNGVAKIEPGNLSVKEGRFESSAASGSVAWSWASGPVPDGDLKLQFPVATRDFGALTALFVPGIVGARADEFTGNIQVSGTVRSPQFAGNVRVRDASFQTVSSPAAPLALGVQHLSGALRFVDGKRLEIAPDAPISGELVAPESLPPLPTATTVAGSAPKTTKASSKAKTSKPPQTDAIRARGVFKLRGSVEIGRNDLTQVASDLPSALASNIYDLRLDVDKARVDAPTTSGLQDAALSASFRTTAPTDAANSQTLRWIGAGSGQAPSKKASGGEIVTRGALLLRSDFASGFASLVRSTPLAWTSGTNDLGDANVASRVPNSAFEDERSQLVFRGFGGKLNGYGSAVLDGRLILDKAPATNRAPDAARLQTIAGAPSLRPFEPLTGARLFGAWKEEALVSPFKQRVAVQPRDVQNEVDTNDANPDVPIRLGGNIVVSNAQISGGGSGAGGATPLSLLPDAPRLDVRLSLGRNVELVNSTLRARLGGDIALSGTPSEPLLLGTVEVLDGQVRFPNARARIEDGRVSINITRDNETDLLRTRLEVDATARGTAGKYTITLRLRGPLQFDARDSQNKSNLQIDVSSNPSLSQDEAFAQLLGVLPSDFANASGSVNVGQANQAYAQAVLQLVSAPFFSGFERSVAQALGLSSVSFEYRFNEPFAFEVSKALGNRVIVTYKRSLGATTTSDGRTPFEFRFDYRLKGDIYSGLRYDERRVYTLTLQKSWRF